MKNLQQITVFGLALTDISKKKACKTTNKFGMGGKRLYFIL